MPASEPRESSDAAAPDPGAAALDRLEVAVGRLLEEFQTARLEAERAEAESGKLREALEALRRRSGGGPGPEELERRLEALAEENRRLRGLLGEARERARRIRSRLMVVEDEL